MSNLYVKLSRFCGFWADRPIRVVVHGGGPETGVAFKEMLKFINKAAVERPGSESRMYWQSKAWGAYCVVSQWGTVEQD